MAEVIPDRLAGQGLHQLAGSERMRKRDADANYPDSFNVAFTNISIDQTQGNAMPVRPGDQQRAMPAWLCGAHCDDSTIRTDHDGQDDRRVARRGRRVRSTAAARRDGEHQDADYQRCPH